MRFGLAAAILWAGLLARRGVTRLPARRIGGLLLMGGVGYVGQSFAYFTALQTISAATTSLLLYTYPALVTLLAWLLLKDRLTLRRAWPWPAPSPAACWYWARPWAGSPPIGGPGLGRGGGGGLLPLYYRRHPPDRRGAALLASAYIASAAAAGLPGRRRVRRPTAPPRRAERLAMDRGYRPGLYCDADCRLLRRSRPRRAEPRRHPEHGEPVITVALAGLVLGEP